MLQIKSGFVFPDYFGASIVFCRLYDQVKVLQRYLLLISTRFEVDYILNKAKLK